MDLALIIAIVALAMAIPGVIDATWNVIAMIRALKKGDGMDPLLLKKSKKLRLDGINNQAAKSLKSLRKSKKEGNNWIATEVMNAMRLARRAVLQTLNGESLGQKRKKSFRRRIAMRLGCNPFLNKISCGVTTRDENYKFFVFNPI